MVCTQCYSTAGGNTQRIKKDKLMAIQLTVYELSLNTVIVYQSSAPDVAETGRNLSLRELVSVSCQPVFLSLFALFLLSFPQVIQHICDR